MSEWQSVKLGDVIEIIGGGTPKTSIPEYWNGNIPWLSVVDFNTGYKFVNKTEKHISEDGLKNSSTKLLSQGDIIISARGTVGAMAVLQLPMTFNQSCYGIRGKVSVTDTQYVYYLLKNTVNELMQFSHGGVFDTITRNTFDEININLPPLSEQKAIADVLSALDDKIDLLQRQNETLEKMAETLFRQWFIEEAKEDWEIYKVSDIADHIKTNIKPNLLGTKIFKHYSLPAFDNGKTALMELGSSILSNKYIVANHSILVSKLNPRVSRVWLILDSTENDICSTEFQNLCPKNNQYLGFLYSLFKSNDVVDHLSMSASGTSGSHQRVRPEDMLNIEFSIPNKEYMIEYSNLIKPFLKKQHQNLQTSQTLQNLRDTLLPKLMSGEVRVKLD